MHQLEKIGPQENGVLGRSRPLRVDWMRRALERCPPFAALDEASFEGLASVCSPVRFPRRGMLYEQGCRADSLYVLASGRVRVLRAAGDSRTLTVAYRVPGELLGETALPDGQCYRATATATEPVEAARMPTRSVQALLTENPAFARRMMSLMVERRIEAERRVESLLSRSVESRVAEFLVDAAERNGLSDARGVLISVRYTHQEIADYVGSTRETVTLTLGEMRRQELVCFDHRRIVIMKSDDLAKLV
jgi:CRP/FNR family transcriptional regulator, cyclic AMP receptor protein